MLDTWILLGLALVACINALAAALMKHGGKHSRKWASVLLLPMLAFAYLSFDKQQGADFDQTEAFIAIVLGALIAISGAAPLIACIFVEVDGDRQSPASAGDSSDAGTHPSDSKSESDDPATLNAPVPVAVGRARAAIGMLERLITYAAVVAGQIEVVALVVLLKVFARDSDVKGSAVVGERYVVATLTSLAWSGGWGFLVTGLVT